MVEVLNVDIYTSSTLHPVFKVLGDWTKSRPQSRLLNDINELKGGDFLFLVSCNEIISKEIISKYKHALVLHASDLPKGRGWSPYVWEIINGASEITISMIEAAERIDRGKIWKKIKIEIGELDLIDEINEKLFEGELKLIEFALENFQEIEPESQSDELASENEVYRKRTPMDSEIDPEKSIIEQFNLLRICDPERYPAFFNYKGKKFKVKLEKFEES